MNPADHLSPGLLAIEVHTVEPEHTAAHLGSGTVKVLSTPSMILFMEIAARKLLDEHLPEGYSSVGVHVDVYHRAPAWVGTEVSASAEIERIEDNRVILAVRVTQGLTIIGEGQHERFIIDVQRFLKRSAGE
jgi:predicted thioesterase